MYSKKIGILGGGQLGRMMLPIANQLDVFIACLDPNPEASCAELANQFVLGDFANYEDVLRFGRMVDVITIEIEHVNVDALKQLEKEGKEVYPQAHVIEIIQDKRLQKQFYSTHNIPTSPFHLIDAKQDIEKYKDFLPAFQKLGKGGYDGGGVKRIHDTTSIHQALEGHSILEKVIDFEKEISVIVSRNVSGQIELFPTVEMVFHPEHNLVDYLLAPAELSEEIDQKAKDIALQIAKKLGIVGLLAVELFVTKDGEVLVNECAPRPHNSGHQTIHAASISQFEQLLRCILDLPLLTPKLTSPSAMVNLLGNEGETGKTTIYGLHKVLEKENVHVVLYGKKTTKPFRKMGHATILANDKTTLEEMIAFVRKELTIGI